MKRALALLLVFTLLPLNAFAGASRSNPEAALATVDEYLRFRDFSQLLEKILASGDVSQLLREAKADDLQLWKEIAQANNLLFRQDQITVEAVQELVKFAAGDTMTQAITASIYSLEPNDFNIFLLHLMERFIERPWERAKLFDLIGTIQLGVAPHLKRSEQLRKGWAENILTSSAYYFAGIVVTALVLRRFAAPVINRTQLMTRIRVRTLALGQKSAALKYGGRLFGNTFVTSLAGSTAMGTIDYMLEANRAQHLDPKSIMMVVHAQLACQISYDAMNFYDYVDKIAADETRLQNEAVTLRRKLVSLQTQNDQLLEQMPWLTNLRLSDGVFKTYLASMPVAKDWNQLRSRLNSEKVAMDGTCHQVSLQYVQQQLETISYVLPEIKAPAAPDVPLELPPAYDPAINGESMQIR